MPLNRATLIGFTGVDPEVRYLPNGDPTVTLNLATTEKWRDKQTGETKETTEWHRLVFYKRSAEIAKEYLKKGSQIYVEGRLQTRKWQDKESGQDRYITEIIVQRMSMLDRKGQNGLSGQGQS